MIFVDSNDESYVRINWDHFVKGRKQEIQLHKSKRETWQ